MIKAIFFDIDGTLISYKDQKMSRRVKKALDLARKKGVLLFVATGRHRMEIEELGLDQEYQFDGYLTMNGGYCYNENEVLYQQPINQKDIQQVIDLIDEEDFPCMFIEANKMYINKHTPLVYEAQAVVGTAPAEITDIHRALDNDVFQFIPYVTEKKMEYLQLKLKQCKSVRWHESSWDVIPNNSGKEKAIEKVIAHYSIDISETMAFGDGHNDIDMLAYVGLGIAMGNAAKETKEASNYVTGSVDDDGIVDALKRFRVI